MDKPELEPPQEPQAQEPETISFDNLPPQEEAIDLEVRIAQLEDEKLRIYADFENTKKRLEREKYQTLEYAYEKIAKDLLPVVDSLDMALQSAQSIEHNEVSAKMIEGITLTLDNFIKTLSKHGIEPIPTHGVFDPHLHDGIMQVASQEHQEGEIVQTLQKGYKYKERVLRPAMVSICKK